MASFASDDRRSSDSDAFFDAETDPAPPSAACLGAAPYEATKLARELPQASRGRPQRSAIDFRVLGYMCGGQGNASPPSMDARMAQGKGQILKPQNSLM